MGDKIENSLGIRQDVNCIKRLRGNPLFVIISIKRSDCVSHRIEMSDVATNKKPISIWLAMYMFNFFIRTIV